MCEQERQKTTEALRRGKPTCSRVGSGDSEPDQTTIERDSPASGARQRRGKAARLPGAETRPQRDARECRRRPAVRAGGAAAAGTRLGAAGARRRVGAGGPPGARPPAAAARQRLLRAAARGQLGGRR